MGGKVAFYEVLREPEVRFGQCRLAHDTGGFARGRVVGDSTPAMNGLMATEGVEALYQLNRQCENRRAGVPLPIGAPGVFRGEVQWVTRYISTRRTEYAFRLVNRQEAAYSTSFGTTIAGLQGNYTKKKCAGRRPKHG